MMMSHGLSGDEEEPEETEAGAVDDEQEEYKAQPETEHSEDSEAMGEEDGEGRPRRNTEAVRNIQVFCDSRCICVFLFVITGGLLQFPGLLWNELYPSVNVCCNWRAFTMSRT